MHVLYMNILCTINGIKSVLTCDDIQSWFAIPIVQRPTLHRKNSKRFCHEFVMVYYKKKAFTYFYSWTYNLMAIK